MPSAMATASLEDPQAVYNAALWTGRQLRSVGINFVLAPVLDINNNLDNPVIGVRSFGDSCSRSRWLYWNRITFPIFSSRTRRTNSPSSSGPGSPVTISTAFAATPRRPPGPPILW